MARKGHTEEQIIAALRQKEAGEKTEEICRKLGISQAMFYTWRKQYAELGVQELWELRQLRQLSRTKHDGNGAPTAEIQDWLPSNGSNHMIDRGYLL